MPDNIPGPHASTRTALVVAAVIVAVVLFVAFAGLGDPSDPGARVNEPGTRQQPTPSAQTSGPTP